MKLPTFKIYFRNSASTELMLGKDMDEQHHVSKITGDGDLMDVVGLWVVGRSEKE